MAEKDFEPGDPMGLVGGGVPEGEPDLMAECLVEEYVRLGTSDAQLLAIFKNPFFAGAHALYRARGEDHLKSVIERVRAQWGRPRFTTTEVGGPDMAPHAPQRSEAPRQSRGALRHRDSFTDSESTEA